MMTRRAVWPERRWGASAMQFLVLGYDGTDADAPARRQAARSDHLAGVEAMRRAGTVLYAAAICTDDERMIGSALVCDFPTRADLDEWLAREPYVAGQVWERIDVHPCKVPPAFLGGS